MTITAISYGGGVQSTALVVLAATGQLHADVAMFANVGDDSERVETLAYVRDVAIPWAGERGFEVVEVQAVHRSGPHKGEPRTLLGELERPESRSFGIPVRMSNGAPGTRRCTDTFKIRVVARELRWRGASSEHPGELMIGISVDEIERARDALDPRHSEYRRAYPLLDLGLSRSQCAQVIRDAGLPVPPKSACWFCPFHRPSTWAEMRRDEPELFDRAQHLEDSLNERRARLGKDSVWLTRFGRRLSDAVAEAQPALFALGDDYSTIGEDGCDEGVCFV